MTRFFSPCRGHRLFLIEARTGAGEALRCIGEKEWSWPLLTLTFMVLRSQAIVTAVDPLIGFHEVVRRSVEKIAIDRGSGIAMFHVKHRDMGSC